MALLLAAICQSHPGHESTAEPATVIGWQHPAPGDHRAPCPGLSTLANYGYLNRNGTDISISQLSSALTDVYHMNDDMQQFLFKGLATGGNLDPVGNLDLNFLRRHNEFTEHDASLVHDDTDNGINWVTNQTLVQRIKTFSSDGLTLSTKDIHRYRLERQAESQVINRNYHFTDRNEKIALFEAAVLLGTMGNGTHVKLDVVDFFLGLEQLPPYFQATPVSLAQALELSRIIKDGR